MNFCYHSHSRFCDGRGEPGEYVLSAIEKGFGAFGFSSHAPVSFPTDWNMRAEDLPAYLSLTRELKEKYADRLELYTGLEADWYPGCADWRTVPGIEYTLGAVHFLPHPAGGDQLPVDGNLKEFRQTLSEGFDGDVQAFGEANFRAMREMLVTYPPNILAHLDVFKKTNEDHRFFSETDAWYREEIEKTLEVALLTDVIIEVNTGGMARGYLDEPYPSPWILEAIRDAGIPIQLNADAHLPEQIDFAYEQTRQALKQLGFTQQRVLLGGIWQDVPL